jgi:antitoxin (DNA-binding transcriptional repressor) of toxin-antitoxin stability system
MPTFSVAEAKNNLSKLIDLALKGERVTITRHGVAVIELRRPADRPHTNEQKLTAEEWIVRLREVREKRSASLPGGAGEFISRMRDEEWEGR